MQTLKTSSGDLTADRRADYAEMLFGSGDPAAAAELLLGALELAPQWAAGWFRLGEMQETTEQLDLAAQAWAMALELDPADRLGASLKLQLIGKAPSAAAPVKSPSRLMFEVDTATVITKALAGIGLEENDFGELIERILYYCELKKTADVRPKTGGLKVPGEGKDIYWVYTESELKVLLKFDCDTFKKKYANQLGAWA